MTAPTQNQGPGNGRLILAACGLLADVTALVTLVKQGAELIPVTLVCVAFLAGFLGLLAQPKPLKVAGAVLLVGGLVGAVLLIGSAQGSRRDDSAVPSSTTRSTPSAAQQAPQDQPATIAELAPQQATTTRAAAPPATRSSSRPAGGVYDLIAYTPVEFGNGHSSVNEISIGNEPNPFPSSIKGYYSSSAADPNNRRTWLTGGKCTRLTVSVGKDTASPKSGGTGRFSVKADDVEIAFKEAAIGDTPQRIDLDITGVSRLTLFDTRGGQDAYNAWGTPQVHCSAPPGKAK